MKLLYSLFFMSALGAQTYMPTDPPSWTIITGAGSQTGLTYPTLESMSGGPGFSFLHTTGLPGSKLAAYRAYLMAWIPFTIPRDLTGQTITMRFRIDVTGAPVFNGQSGPFECDNSVGNRKVRLFFWTNPIGPGGFQFTWSHDRWWSNQTATDLGGGTYSVTVPVDPSRWSTVDGTMGTGDLPAFTNAVQNAAIVGATFGNACTFGHGVNLLGTAPMTANFVLTEYSWAPTM